MFTDILLETAARAKGTRTLVRYINYIRRGECVSPCANKGRMPSKMRAQLHCGGEEEEGKTLSVMYECIMFMLQ